MWFGLEGIELTKQRERHNREEYVRSLEGKAVEWDGDKNVEDMWDQVKWGMVERARKVCGSVRVWGRTQRVWCKDERGCKWK